MIKIIILVCSLLLTNFSNMAATIDTTLHYQHETSKYIKYGGVLTTPMKTLPVAVSVDGVEYYVYSKVNSTHQLFMIADSLGNRTAVMRMYLPSEGPDFHDSPAVRVASDGYIHFIKAARGSWRKGYYFISVRPYDISEFRLVKDTDWAYPQLHSMSILYTRYEGYYRTLNAVNSTCDIKLVEGGHYSVSNYDGEYIHLFYNYHPDGDLDRRTGVYYIRSRDGCNWENRDGVGLSLPLESDSELSLITRTKYSYLKDVAIINGIPTLLYVDSSSYNPNLGERLIKTISVYGVETDIAPTCHNYNSGSFVNNKIFFPVCGYEQGRAGGQINTFTLDGRMIDVTQSLGSSNFIRKVLNGQGYVYGDTVSGQINNDSYIKRNQE